MRSLYGALYNTNIASSSLKKMNRLVYVFGRSGRTPTTVHGHVWVAKDSVRFDSTMPWIARDVKTNSIVGQALVKQSDVVLIYVRPGAGVIEHEESRLRVRRHILP